MSQKNYPPIYGAERTGNSMFPYAVYEHGNRATKVAYVLTNNPEDALTIADALTKYGIRLTGRTPTWAFEMQVDQDGEYKINL